ncbi:protein disulfide isomerase5 [Zea mays]|uniref:protein disulfide-isomerase n=1 Tax=Zea mays TaxID=4577 RepID=A0A1D6NUN7_MAIZE|nr:protein disulfide isomerase5 [Zea mays]
MRARWAVTLLLLAVLALTASAARLDLDDDDDSGVLDELLAIDEEAERGGLLDAEGAGEAVRRAQSMVLALDNDNARRAVEDHAELLLLGYAPWCERSAQLMPRFAEAAAALRAMGSAVAFAKLDGERYPKAAAAVGVKGFPTVLLFVNGTEHAYHGLHTKDAIVTWVRKKTGVPIIRLQSKDSAEEFLKKDMTFVIGLFKNFEGADHEEFVKAATTDNEVQFVETSDTSVAKVLFPDGKFEEKEILRFVELNKFPLITVFTELNSGKVYSSPIELQVFTFAEAYDFEDLESMVEEIARAFKTKIMFIYVDTAEENLAKPFLTLYGLESEKKPTVTAFDTSNGAKYLMEADINANNLREFCLSLLDGTLPPYHKSEPLPQEKGLIEKVVGRTFDSSVLESHQNVFLEVHTPWCVDCEAISKNVEKLAKHFSGSDNLKFARIDASVNEHPKLKVNNYPTLFLYLAEDKSNPIKLSKKSSVKDMAKLIKEKLQIPDVETVAAPDNVKDEL